MRSSISLLPIAPGGTPRYTDGGRRVMYFKDTAKPGPVPSADALAVLDSYLAWRRTSEGAAWAQ